MSMRSVVVTVTQNFHPYVQVGCKYRSFKLDLKVFVAIVFFCLLGATSINKIGEVRLFSEIGGGGSKI